MVVSLLVILSATVVQKGMFSLYLVGEAKVADSHVRVAPAPFQTKAAEWTLRLRGDSKGWEEPPKNIKEPLRAEWPRRRQSRSPTTASS